MSLQHAAKYLEAHGRDNDTELVHMSKNEVNNLRQLAQMHGGDLSKNPHTGLTEAGFLDSILPMVIGGATAIFAPAALPYVIGGVGLANYAKTGSLTKGVMAGLGAYGGSGLAAGLAGVGANTAASTLASESSAAGYGTDAAVNAKDALLSRAGDAAAGTSLGTAQAASPLATGLSTAISNPSALATQMGGYGALAKAAGMAAAPALLSAATSGVNSGTPSGASGQITPYTYARNPVDASKLNLTGSNFVQGQNPDTSERLFFHPQYTALPPYTYTSAEGGAVPPPTSFNNMNAPMSHNANANYANYSQMPMPQNPMSSGATLMASGGQTQNNNGLNQLIDPATGMPYQRSSDPLSALVNMGQSGQHFSTPFADGGQTDGHLGDYSDGGRLLKGPGDGVSDSIPATIAGKQPARLADGEFVVPARIVSELGNGSTDAGARKLYDMLDRIQRARGESVGKGKVAKNTKADRYLPA